MNQTVMMRDGEILNEAWSNLQDLAAGSDKFLIAIVPSDWQHPTTQTGLLAPLGKYADFQPHLQDWCDDCAQWLKGLRRAHGPGPKQYVPIEAQYKGVVYEDYAGPRPNEADYLPAPPTTNQAWVVYMRDISGISYVPMSPKLKNPGVLLDWVNNLMIVLGK